jgi:hypothetical protein
MKKFFPTKKNKISSLLSFLKSRKFEGWILFGIYEDAEFYAAS